MAEFPRIIAHRGASSLAPENTVAAFAKCIDLGVQWFEFDVDIIGDGTLIVIHDQTLDRTTDKSGPYYKLNYSDLRKIDAGAWFAPTFRFERIPELASVLGLIRDNPLRANLEIKPCLGGDELRRELVTRVARSLKELEGRAADKILVSSFDHEQLAWFHEKRPDIPTGYLFDRETQDQDAWRTEAAELGCLAIHPDDNGLTRDEVAAMRDAGFEVNVWTVDDVDRARELAEWGVNGIFTNRPQDFPAEAYAI